jgi:hypothetical protein
MAKLIVGTGDTAWEVIHPFGRLPRFYFSL